MLDTYTELLGKFPAWARWLFVPIAAMLAYLTVVILLGVILTGSGEDHLFRPIVIFVGQPLFSSFASTFIAFLTAPNGKLFTTIVVGLFFITLGVWGIYFYGSLETQFWLLSGSVASTLGAVGAIIIAYANLKADAHACSSNRHE